MGGLLKGDSLMVNDDIAEDTTLKELKHTKNSKSENLGEAQSIRIKTWRQKTYCLQKTTFNRKFKASKSH